MTGSITPGKAADLVILAGDSLALNPVNIPFGAVVYAAHPGHVRDVMVAGRWRKRDGRLVDVDVDRLLRLARESRDHVFGSMPESRLGRLDPREGLTGHQEGRRRSTLRACRVVRTLPNARGAEQGRADR